MKHLTTISVALYLKQVNIFLLMIIPITILLGAVGYLYYNSKVEASLIELDQLDSSKEKIKDDDLYKDLEDLFI